MFTMRKSLGQHFLKDENICKKIVAYAQESPVERLLEVGPGGGALTKYLVKMPGIDFKAVEVDEEKIDYLVATFPQMNGKIINESFLDIGKPFENRFSVIGNFPYNISTQILFKIFEWKHDINWVIGMFQKEVAQRIAAREGSKVYGITSVLAQAYFDVEYLFEVNEASFQPPPKVKSAVIRLKPRRNNLLVSSEEKFFMLVKAAFNQRRKKLRNAVKNLYDADTLKNEIFDKRAEQLTVEDFASLSFKMRP